MHVVVVVLFVDVLFCVAGVGCCLLFVVGVVVDV